MRLIDDKGRIFGKLNIIDALVVLFAIWVIGGMSYQIIRLHDKMAAQEKLVKENIAPVRLEIKPMINWSW